jgi:hypothetical protein
VLDVAHNPHAAATLAQNLGNMGFHRFTYAVFGIMQDKDIDAVIAHMAPGRPLVRGGAAVAALGRRAGTGRETRGQLCGPRAPNRTNFRSRPSPIRPPHSQMQLAVPDRMIELWSLARSTPSPA